MCVVSLAGLLRICASSCLLSWLMMGTIGSAESSPPVATSQTPTAAKSEEVRVDVVVRDRHGRLLRDLRADDLQIVDDGGAVKVTHVQPVDVKGPLFVSLVFDSLDAVSARLARDAALEMLKQNPGGDSSFSVWRIHDRLQMLQGFTTDREALRRAVEAVASMATHPKGGDIGAAAAAPRRSHAPPSRSCATNISALALRAWWRSPAIWEPNRGARRFSTSPTVSTSPEPRPNSFVR